jgi:hypothetical protein
VGLTLFFFSIRSELFIKKENPRLGFQNTMSSSASKDSSQSYLALLSLSFINVNF